MINTPSLLLCPVRVLFALFLCCYSDLNSFAADKEKKAPADPRYVSLDEAHKGTVEIDLKILNQFVEQPKATSDFYVACREALCGDDPVTAVPKVCAEFGRNVMGGPMLGQLTHQGVAIWMNLPLPASVQAKLTNKKTGESQTFVAEGERTTHPVIQCQGLSADTNYSYQVLRADTSEPLGAGSFTTAPSPEAPTTFKLAIGADFHKIGLHRPELLRLVRARGSRAMALLGDLAVDGRKDDFALRKVDYMLRDISPTWQQFAAHIPCFASWDDHDYFGNDSHGRTTKSGKPIPVDDLRACWKKHWNNPESTLPRHGIYFQTRIGPVHLIMLDSRSCRVNEKRGELHSFLGPEQTAWFKDCVRQSDAPFILITCGTMWTDYISAGKDSWGTWDLEGREEIYQVLDTKTEAKVILFSGDRHGTHAFKIPRPNGPQLYEFGVGTLGGVPGGGKASDLTHQLFAYPGAGTWAYGELEFQPTGEKPLVTFRLINEKGEEVETVKW